MTATGLEIHKFTARIGARVTGVDISKELDRDTVAALRAALNEHKALVFGDVHLDDEGQQRFARHFGELTTAHPAVPAAEGAPNVLPVDSDRGRSNHWHTDVTFGVNPRWRWSPNQLVEFDNRITQHYAIDNYGDRPRRLNRVTVAGDVPVVIDGRHVTRSPATRSHYTAVARPVA